LPAPCGCVKRGGTCGLPSTVTGWSGLVGTGTRGAAGRVRGRSAAHRPCGSTSGRGRSCRAGQPCRPGPTSGNTAGCAWPCRPTPVLCGSGCRAGPPRRPAHARCLPRAGRRWAHLPSAPVSGGRQQARDTARTGLDTASLVGLLTQVGRAEGLGEGAHVRCLSVRGGRRGGKGEMSGPQRKTVR
jgi:hypothetical protein